MKRKTIIRIVIALVVIIVLMAGFRVYTKSHSPVATSSVSSGGTDLTVVYCKPYKKGRLIFGEESSGALQPYGKYWRMGANEATTFETSTNITFGSGQLAAGKYQLYAIPGKEKWQIILNKNWDRWGAMDADRTTDVLVVEVPADNNAEQVEQLRIEFDNVNAEGKLNMKIHWDKTMVIVPIAIK